MKILLDENLDEGLREFLPDHDVFHVVGLGWQGTKNGALLAKTEEAAFRIFVTADKGMPYQQRMAGRSFSLFVLDIHPNVLRNQAACLEIMMAKLDDSVAGHVYVIEGPHSKRGRQ